MSSFNLLIDRKQWLCHLHIGWCDLACNTAECGWDHGDCIGQTCAPQCVSLWIGDGTCDQGCNVPECEYDRGDCGSTDNDDDVDDGVGKQLREAFAIF